MLGCYLATVATECKILSSIEIETDRETKKSRDLLLNYKQSRSSPSVTNESGERGYMAMKLLNNVF